jgi:hypothetical protein
VAHEKPLHEVITAPPSVVVPASIGAPASTGATWQVLPWHERPEQQSAVLVHATVAPPQLARHLSSAEVVVPRHAGYAAQHPPFTYEAVQLSPDAQTPASIGPASICPASGWPASFCPASG